MSTDPTVTHTPSDAELIAAVRGGDAEAYGSLFERHRDAALRLARQIAGHTDADDLVSDAFTKVFKVLQGGGGPDVAFRAYLLTAVRRLHVDRIRSESRVTPTDDMEKFDPGVPFVDPAVAGFENAAAAQAFASLPERWQLVLWHLEVEQQKPVDIAPLLGMSANGVSALAYRAREGLRQAYLQRHLADTGDEQCRWVTERLGAHVRKGLSRRDATKVDEHLNECRRCAGVYLELGAVNSSLAGIIAPVLLGTAAAGYLASTGSSATGVALLLLKARHFQKAHGALTAGGAAAGAAAVAVSVAVIVSGPDAPRDTAADIPAPTVPAITQGDTPQTAPPGSSSDPPGESDDPPSRRQLGPFPPPDTSDPTPAPRTPGTTPASTPPTTGTASSPPPTTSPDRESNDPSSPSDSGDTSSPGRTDSGDPTSRPPSSPPASSSPPSSPSPSSPSSPSPSSPSPSEPTTPRPTTPRPTSPSTTRVDLVLSQSPRTPITRVTLHARGRGQPAGPITVFVRATLPIDPLRKSPGWDCSSGLRVVSCTHPPTSNPGPIQVGGVVLRGTATVTAARNTDPVGANNSVSWGP